MQNSIKEEESNKDMFEFLYTSIYWLDLTDKTINCFHLLFMMKLTKHLGFYPRESTSGKEKFFDLQEGVFLQQKPLHPHYLEGDVLEQWEQLISCRYEEIGRLKISINQKRILVQALMDYYKLHLNYFKELNSQILQTVSAMNKQTHNYCLFVFWLFSLKIFLFLIIVKKGGLVSDTSTGIESYTDERGGASYYIFLKTQNSTKPLMFTREFTKRDLERLDFKVTLLFDSETIERLFCRLELMIM